MTIKLLFAVVLMELEEAREQAMATGQASAAIAATWAKARLLGMDKSSVHIEHEVTFPRQIRIIGCRTKKEAAD